MFFSDKGDYHREQGNVRTLCDNPRGEIITRRLKQFIYDVHEKRPEDDGPVVIEDDVWIGVGAIILKDVTVGRGCDNCSGAGCGYP